MSKFTLKKKILIIFGTRPEAIKMAPVIKALLKEDNLDVKVCITAQHREMLDQVLDLFSISPDFDLNLMRAGQDLTDITSSVLLGLRGVFKVWRPDWVLVHGDTTTTLAASLAAYYEKISVGHVEAGLRTHDIYSPWPEELNRKLTTGIAKVHFAPTKMAKANLIKEGVDENDILVTGNTIIDALLDVSAILKNDLFRRKKLDKQFSFLNEKKRLILVTGHRRENFGEGFNSICGALNEISLRNDVEIIIPVHLNPNVQVTFNRLLADNQNIHLVEPLEYLPFIYLMNRSFLILTDSGGVQEEAPSLGKPVLLMRETTERPEAVLAGTVKLVGTCKENVLLALSELLDDPAIYVQMSGSSNPYGNGTAAEKIAKFLREISIGNIASSFQIE